MTATQIEQYLAQLDFVGNLELLPPDAHLVGGSVRDAILNRSKTPWDLDFVVAKKAIATARTIANFYQAGFVVLDQERDIARVVFPQGTWDFALQAGKTIEEDLYRRDFTLNAIAYNLATQQIIDPLNGLKDLQQGILRMVSSSNLEDDPLRLLRAYRQAAQLNLTIEETTRIAIRERTAQLSAIAAERVQAELNYLFTAPQGELWLTAAIQDDLLDYWLPSINSEKLKELSRLKAGIDLAMDLGWDTAELKVLSKLATLVANDSTTAEAELSQLKYSRAQIKAVTKTVEYLPQLPSNINNLSLRKQYFWFLAVKDIFPLLMIRAIATGITPEELRSPIHRYTNPKDPVVYPQPLVTGNDLMQELNLKPSRLIGELLTELQIARIEAKIATPQQAIDFAQTLLAQKTL